MGTNINSQRILSRKSWSISDGVGGDIPFDPKSDTDGTMELWLQAKAADILLGTGNYITKWKDNESGSGIQYDQGIEIKQPIWNSLDEYVVFDTNDFLNSLTPIDIRTAPSGWCVAITCYMVDWNLTQVVIGDDNSNNCLFKFFDNDSFQMKLYNPIAGTSTTKGVTIDTPSSLTNAQTYVIIWNMNPINNDVSVYIDGVRQLGVFAFPMGYDLTELDEIGAKNGGTIAMTGGIKEYIVYDGELSSEDITKLNTYMYDKI